MLLDIDATDLQLLRLLQENGRAAQNDLARAVGLSAPAVADRLRKLEERGVIRHYTAVLEPKRLGWDVTAFLFVGIAGSRYFEDFRARARAFPEIVECHSVTGQGSHLLKIRAENTEALEALLAEIQAWPGVQWTNTSVVLSTVKEVGGTPLFSPESSGTPSGEEDPIGSAGLLRVPFRHQP